MCECRSVRNSSVRRRLKMELTKENLKKSILEALKVSRKVQLFYRPEGIKYGEDEAVIRLDLDTYKGLSVGDLCTPMVSDPMVSERPKITHGAFLNRCVIAGFVEMTGWVMGAPRKIKTKDIFCVLAYSSSVKLPPNFEPQDLVVKITLPPSKMPILLFPIEKVKKLEQE